MQFIGGAARDESAPAPAKAAAAGHEPAEAPDLNDDDVPF
jgi:hypothetical protein